MKGNCVIDIDGIVWWQEKRYCSNMPNGVSAIDGNSHNIQIPRNEPQQKKTHFQQTNSFH
jgi:hypothetical protein